MDLETFFTVIMVLMAFFVTFFGPVIIGLVIYKAIKDNKQRRIEKDINFVIQIKSHDPYFDPIAFKNSARDCIMEVYNCFYNLNFDRLRMIESTDLYDIHKIDLETGLITGNLRTLKFSSFGDIIIDNYYIDGDKEVLCCSATAFSKDMIFEPRTKENLLDVPKYVFHQMKLEFSRHLGVKTTPGKEFALKECPNCGAEVTLNTFGQCSYCNSVVINGEHSWVLNKISDLYSN